MSSIRITSPVPMIRVSPSLAVIRFGPSRLITYWRRVAVCQSKRHVPGVKRKMMQVAGKRLEVVPSGPSSAHSISMSRKWLSPYSSA